jgi:AraC-like DNA-binding protein
MKSARLPARRRESGLVETAQGALFLDEIGDVPLAMQVKLLRLIESGTYRRVGGVETLHANFRLVAATHKPLEKMMVQGEFRQDLYYRISAFPIALPPLRERAEDIALLVNSFLQRAGAGKRKLTIEPGALLQLQQHSWPGNVRELRNVLERARLFADDGVIRTGHLPAPSPAARPAASALAALPASFGGTRSELAAQLGISERTLYRRLKVQGLACPGLAQHCQLLPGCQSGSDPACHGCRRRATKCLVIHGYAVLLAAGMKRAVDLRLNHYLPFKRNVMQMNVGNIDRAVRILAGLGLITAAVFGVIGPWGWIGVIPLATGVFRFCPAYLPFGIRTCRMKK